MSKLKVEEASKPKIKSQYIKDPARPYDLDEGDLAQPEFVYKVPYCTGNYTTSTLSNRDARSRLAENNVANPEQYLPTERDEQAGTRDYLNNVELIQIRFRQKATHRFRPIVDLYFYSKPEGIEQETYGSRKHFVLAVQRRRGKNTVKLFALTMFINRYDDGIHTNSVYDETAQTFYNVENYAFNAYDFTWEQYHGAHLWGKNKYFVDHT